MVDTLMSIEDRYCELELDDASLLERTSNYEIWLDGPFIRIKELNVDIYPGVYCQYDELEDAYVPDFTIHVFRKIGTKEIVYDEGYSNIYAAINNYAKLINIALQPIEQLKCKLIYKK